MKVFHVVIEYDSGLPDIIDDIKYIRDNRAISGHTDDMLAFLLKQLKEAQGE